MLGGQCGKTSYIFRFLTEKFDPKDSAPTVGIQNKIEPFNPHLFLENNYRKNIYFDGEECKLDILDTSGDDAYTNLRQKVGDKYFEFLLFIHSGIKLLMDTLFCSM